MSSAASPNSSSPSSSAVQAEATISAVGIGKIYRRDVSLWQWLVRGLGGEEGEESYDAANSVAAVRDVSFSVQKGEAFGIIGRNGAGKSTLLKLLFGAQRASSGEVLVGGRNMTTITREGVASLRREIGVVFQDFKLLPRRTVLDNVAYGLEVLGVNIRERRRLALLLLHAMGLEDRIDAYPVTLSGGEQQRVAIARALIRKPKLILADEPTGNLDHEMSRRVFDLLLEANAAGVTVVVATHNLAMIEELNRRSIVLDRGKIIGDFAKPSSVGGAL
jgi:cell division transport system ATP-binding protein